MLDAHTELKTRIATYEAADLLAALAFFKPFIKKASYPIFESVLFRGDGTAEALDGDARGNWTFSGNAADMQHTPVPIPFKSLQKAMRGADKGKLVTLEVHETHALLTVDDVTSKITTPPVRNWPEMSFILPEDVLLLKGEKDLRADLEFVQSCVSSEETRYYLNGVYLHGDGTTLTAVATDGHRLARRRIRGLGAETPQDWPGLIVPRLTVDAVISTLDKKSDASVSMALSRKYAQFKTAKWCIETRCVEGTFPVYQRVIPQKSSGNLVLDVRDAKKSLNRLVGFTSSTSAKGVLGVSLSGGSLSRRDEDGDVHTVKDFAENVHGPCGEYCVNLRYLNGAVQMIAAIVPDAVKLNMRFSTDGTPFVLPVPGTEDDLLLVMPMRVTD